MFLTLQDNDKRPIYQQITDGIKDLIARGELREGMTLPSVRQVAGDLGVNLNTVAVAYRQLQDEGFVTVRHGAGAVISSRSPHPDGPGRTLQTAAYGADPVGAEWTDRPRDCRDRAGAACAVTTERGHSMSAPSEVGIYVFIICLLVPVMTYALVKQIWNQPLQNGPGYFLGIEVPAGFYEGPGRRWMTGYHAMVAALYGVWAVALGAIITTRRWEMSPIWAGGVALLFVPTMVGFQLWTRHKLGVNPPVRPVALALTTRRYSDYISWPMEALAVALVGLSWWLLLRHSGTHFDWLTPLTLSWGALGMIPGKMAMVRVSWPLPTERTEEHYRLQDASRRFSIRVNGLFFEWFPVIVLLGVALLHGLSPASPGGGVALAGAGLLYRGVGIRGDAAVPRAAGDKSDGPRTATDGKLEDAVQAGVVFWDGPGVLYLVCDMVRRDSGFHLVSVVQGPILNVELIY